MVTQATSHSSTTVVSTDTVHQHVGSTPSNAGQFVTLSNAVSASGALDAITLGSVSIAVAALIHEAAAEYFPEASFQAFLKKSHAYLSEHGAKSGNDRWIASPGYVQIDNGGTSVLTILGVLLTKITNHYAPGSGVSQTRYFISFESLKSMSITAKGGQVS